jgi:hypothetical protein
MLIELATALLLSLLADSTVFPRYLVMTCFGLTIAVFAVTAFISVPQHQILSQGFKKEAHSKLVQTNWIRTVIWTGHAALCFWFSVFFNFGVK